mmetsp:Transcript_17604/g.56928  ORF Transcript_17604/g.56928 Transcript_17604/m.56928 type:complete len:275 (+) Transcript_17604:2479-3303(+)
MTLKSERCSWKALPPTVLPWKRASARETCSSTSQRGTSLRSSRRASAIAVPRIRSRSPSSTVSRSSAGTSSQPSPTLNDGRYRRVAERPSMDAFIARWEGAAIASTAALSAPFTSLISSKTVCVCGWALSMSFATTTSVRSWAASVTVFVSPVAASVKFSCSPTRTLSMSLRTPSPTVMSTAPWTALPTCLIALFTFDVSANTPVLEARRMVLVAPPLARIRLNIDPRDAYRESVRAIASVVGSASSGSSARSSAAARLVPWKMEYGTHGRTRL